MLDTASLIYSDIHGWPNRNGGFFHCIGVSDVPSTATNQLNFPQFPNDACVPAVTAWLLLRRGISVPYLVLEQDEGTGPTGTYLDRVPPTLALYGVSSRIVMGTPSPGWVMNPNGSGNTSNFAPYGAAAYGAMVVVDAPPPPIPPAEEDDVKVVFNSVIRGSNSTWIGDYIGVRCFQSAQDITDCLYNMNLDGVKYVVRPGNVANPRAFGAALDAFSVAALP